MQRFTKLSDLKLRASWAKTGNQAFGDYLWSPTYRYSNNTAQVQFGQNFVTTIRPGAVDPNIHWESTASVDVGLDFGFDNQRISGTIDWYNKKTTDMIFTVPVCAGCYFSNYVTTNIGSMQNRGIEFTLSARILQGHGRGLGWTADFTASHNANELLTINPSRSVTQINTGNISGGVGNQVEVLLPGHPINSFYVWEQKYANGKPVVDANPLNMYVDRNNDGQINNLDYRPYHSPWPSLELGHTSFFTYKSWDVSFTMRAQLGNYVYNNVASAGGSAQNVTTSATPSNMDVSILETGFTAPQYWSDYYVQKASFLRMDNITLGYSWQMGGRPWRGYLTVQSAFTITGYKGVDPTAGLQGIDNNIYPRARTFTGGLSVRF